LERCRQCDNNGWGKCAINDDLPVLLEKMHQADAVAFATPVYFGDLSESMCGLLERVRRVAFNETGKIGLAGKPVVGLCVAGGRGMGAPSAAMGLERMLMTCGFDVLDVVSARKQNLEMKLVVLETTGRWLVERPIQA
jgi:multimeric flavodoxin WrbA